MCKVLQISKSAYYSWLKGKPNKFEQANYSLDANIKSLFNEHKERYGSVRITRSLKALSIQCSKNLVAKRMRILNIRAKAKKKFKLTTDSEHKHPIFENVLDRDFTSQSINQKWVGDITYIPTREGWLYLCIVMDLYSRAIIGWSMSQRLKFRGLK